MAESFKNQVDALTGFAGTDGNYGASLGFDFKFQIDAKKKIWFRYFF